MKKLFLFIGIALLAFSCSSDDKEDDNTPTAKLKQYPVDYTISVEDLNKAIEIDKELELPPVLFFRGVGGSNEGIAIYYGSSEYTAFDMCCPVFWEKSSGARYLAATYINEKVILYNAGDSRYDPITLQATYGKAKELGLSLVQYKIELDEEKKEYHITNPNYKK